MPLLLIWGPRRCGTTQEASPPRCLDTHPRPHRHDSASQGSELSLLVVSIIKPTLVHFPY